MPISQGAERRPVRRAVSAVSLACAMLPWAASPVRAQTAIAARPLGKEIPVFTPVPGDLRPRESPQVRNPAGPLSLQDALSLSLLQNPRLAAFSWETRAWEARALQAGRAPNPVLGAVFEDLGAPVFAGGGINEPVQQQLTLQLSQLVELGGKRAARRRLALLNRDLAGWDYETERVRLFTDVTRAFIDVLASQESLAQIERTIRLVEDMRQAVGLRVAAGVVSPIEETRAEVASASVRAEFARARHVLDASRTRLASLWSSSTAAFSAAEGSLQATPPSLPPFASLLARVDQSPELARWASEFPQRDAAVALERSRAVPDVSVAAGYRRFTALSANALIVGASISLPFFDRNQGAIQEAQSRAAQAREQQRAAHARVTAALADAYAALASAHDEAAILRTAVLPGSRQAFEAVSEGYRLGRFGYLDVLESQRTLIGASTQYLRALSDYHKAAADIERLTGAPLIEPAPVK